VVAASEPGVAETPIGVAPRACQIDLARDVVTQAFVQRPGAEQPLQPMAPRRYVFGVDASIGPPRMASI
jgi:hypothetical protein